MMDNKIKSIIVITLSLLNLVLADYRVESPRFKPFSPMVVAFKECNESYANVFYEPRSKQWSLSKFPTCLNTEKDLLSFCQRIYPKLNVINIFQLETMVKFHVYDCENANEQDACVLTPIVKYSRPYKCLYGDFKDAQLKIPMNCQSMHLYNQNECKSSDHWRLLSNEKCKTQGLVLNSSHLLQWCDAFTSGYSSFTGINFVCCPPSKTVKTTTTTTKKVNTEYPIDQEEVEDEEENIDDGMNYDYPSDTPPNTELNTNKIDLSKNMEHPLIDLDKLSGGSSSNSGSTFRYATTFFIVGFFVTISFAIIYAKLRRNGGLFSSICNKNRDESILINNFNTDDSNMNSMQVNGYENPTYRFFEQTVKA